LKDSYDDFGLQAPDPNKIKSLIGHPLDYMYEHLGVDKDRVWDFVDRYKFHYRKRSKIMTHFLPDAKEAIIEASKFARLHYFEVLIGRENVTHPKPHPEPILKALHKMNISYKENIFMIGDTCLDMVSANDAGIKAIGVTCGYATIKQLQKCTKFIYSDTKRAVSHINNFIKL